MDDRIGDWSAADLRRFIVNEVMSDPGSYPKNDADPRMSLPPPINANGATPVWDTASQRWLPSITAAGDINKVAAPSFTFVRCQSTPSGFIVDANFRIYNWTDFGGAGRLYVSDPYGYFTLNSANVTVNKSCIAAVSMFSVGPNSGNYAQGWSPVYNGTVIDVAAGGNYYQATAATIQQGNANGWVFARLSPGDVIKPGGYCNSGVPTVGLNLLLVYPS